MRILIGWVFNYLGFAFLLTVYVVYGCTFESLSSADSSEAFMISWLWSVVQRFLAMEPIIILVGALLPMLFASRAAFRFAFIAAKLSPPPSPSPPASYATTALAASAATAAASDGAAAAGAAAALGGSTSPRAAFRTSGDATMRVQPGRCDAQM